MRALVINLATATDRMALQAEQLGRLQIPYERIEAVTPATLAPPADDPVWHRWQRPLRVTEMALLASHVVAWRRVIELAEPCLVLEDDALLASATPAFLASLAALTDVDHVSLETRGRKKLVSRRPDPRAPMRRLWQDRTGSAAYLVFPAGARLLLDHAARIGGPSDAIISSTYTMRSFQADPALAIQLDQCPAHGIPQPIPSASSIDAVAKPVARHGYPPLARLGFKFRRIGAQIRMGSRQLARLGHTERRLIAPAADFPAPTVISSKG